MPHKYFAWRYLLTLLVLLATACSAPPDTGPVEVKWDRDVCKRCSMVLSDRYHSAQIRAREKKDKHSKVYLFDDIGCALIWLDDKPWRDDPQTEIWVNDHRDGSWIDARKAYYIPGQITPMEYGLGAQPEPADNALNFEQARQQIFAMEKRFNTHNIHLKESAMERQPQGSEREQ